MFQTVDDFARDWKAESEATLKIMHALTDASLKQRVGAGGRSLGRLAWHIVQTLGEMPQRAGVRAETIAEDAPQPASAAEIADSYARAAATIGDGISAQWTDAMLSDKVEMYGEMWTRAGALAALVMHQAHHRGQMTVLMRQAGLKVPGIYGPASEEWAQFGMTAPE
jgi:uncharacterized damage-inducible protein DinB